MAKSDLGISPQWEGALNSPSSKKRGSAHQQRRPPSLERWSASVEIKTPIMATGKSRASPKNVGTVRCEHHPVDSSG